MTGTNGQVAVRFNGLPVRAGLPDRIGVFHGTETTTADPLHLTLGQVALVSRPCAIHLLREYPGAFERVTEEDEPEQGRANRSVVLFWSGLGNFVLATPLIRQLESPEIYVHPTDPRAEAICDLSPWPVTIADGPETWAGVTACYVPGALAPFANRPPARVLRGALEHDHDWRASSLHERDYYGAWLDGFRVMPPVVKTSRRWTLRRGARERIVALANGAGSSWNRSGLEWSDTKRWPTERWAAVAAELSGRGIQFVALGSAREREWGESIVEAARERAWNFAGLLRADESADVLSQADLVLCNDTGLMHVAAAVGTRIVALWGGTLWTKNAPLTDRVGRIDAAPDSCPHLPCFGTPRQLTCRDARCMASITVEQVTTAILDALGMPA
jgi:hypothetical protein